MVTRNHTPVGASNSNPNTALPAGQEVTSPGTTTLVPAGGAPAVPSTTSDVGLVAAVKSFRESLGALRVAFDLHMRTLTAGSTRRKGALDARRAAIIPPLADLQRQYPSLSSVDPDEMLVHFNGSTAVGLAVKDIQSILTEAEDTERLEMVDAWARGSTIYAAACHRAKTDRAFAVKLAPLQATLKHGKQVDTNPLTTATAAVAVTKAQTRAAKAQQRAHAASQSQARANQARAAAHPTTVAPVPAAVNQGPAVPTPADASNQGPSATAAASYQGPAVNPQGPAR